jgi:hypothetical protein
MFYTISVAIAQIGNNDKIGIFTSKYIADGDISFAIARGPAATIRAKTETRHHQMRARKPRAVMQFDSIKLARDCLTAR